MLSCNQRISLRQFQMLFLLEAFGTGFLLLPRRVAAVAGPDGWWVALWLLLPGLGLAFLVTSAAGRFGREPFAAYTRRLLGTPLSVVVCVLLWLKIIVCAGLELRLASGIVRSTLLAQTPSWAVVGLVLAVAAYAALKGIETRARVAEILLPLVAVAFGLLVLFSVFNADPQNLMPVLTTPPERVAVGVLRLGFLFTGLEFLWFVFPYLNTPEKGRRAALGAVAITGVTMAGVTALCLAKFGPENVQAAQWPVLDMMDMVSLPGTMVARQGALVLSIWLLSVVAFAGASVFFSAVLGRTALRRGTHKRWVAIAALAVLAVALVPLENAQATALLDGIFRVFGLAFLVGLPIILLVLDAFHRRAERRRI